MPNSELVVPKNEFERLVNLSKYNIDYQAMEGKLDDLTKLASYVTGTSISRINIIDANTIWTISNFGMEGQQMARKDAPCQYAVYEDAPVEVTNLARDDRFKDKNYVTGGPNLRFYFGLPLTTNEGYNLGTLCVLDDTEHTLTPEKKNLLKIIANEVVVRIDYENRLKIMQENMNELKEIQRKVSHDIRGPIGGIIGIADLLRDQAEENKMEEFLELIELINKGGRSVLDLADEILSNYDETIGEFQVPKNQVTLDMLKEKLEHLYQPQASNKSISYKIKVEGESVGISFTKHKLLQILGNLISNAIKFTPEGGSVNVSLDLRQSDLELVATITDSGIGMSEEQINKIMQESGAKTISTPGTKQERGFGYGFRLARHLIKKVQGSIHINSKENQGTEITVRIPL